MAFKEYTSPVKPGNYINLSGTAIGIRNIIILALTGQFFAWLIYTLAGGPPGLIAAIALFLGLVIYLTWWLDGRLIYLGGEECLIGVVTSLGPADPVEKGGDNDFSMYVLLAPGPTKFTEEKTLYWNTKPQGHLVAENDDVLGISRGYVQGGNDHHKYVTALHCEFEGDGIKKLRIWAMAVLGVLALALAFDLLGVPFLKGLLIILAIILSLFAGSDRFTPPAGPGAGDPRDIDPSLGEMAKGDIVIVKGEWIYDSLHHGWNEIHPVRDCQIIGRMELGEVDNPATPAAPWPPNLCGIGLDTTNKVELALTRWCLKLDECRDTETHGSRADPQNDWVIHPRVDGCKPPPVIL